MMIHKSRIHGMPTVSEHTGLNAGYICKSKLFTLQAVDYPRNEHIATRSALINIQQRKQQNLLEENCLLWENIEEVSNLPPVIKLKETKDTLRTFPGIADVNKILRTGVKVFSTPCKLFILDSLRQLKRKGNLLYPIYIHHLNYRNRVSQSITL